MIIARVVWIIIGFFFVRYLGTAFLGWREVTADVVAGVLTLINLAVLAGSLKVLQRQKPDEKSDAS